MANREEKLSEIRARLKAMQEAPGGISQPAQVSEWAKLNADFVQLSDLGDGEVQYNPTASRWETAPSPQVVSLADAVVTPDEASPEKASEIGGDALVDMVDNLIRGLVAFRNRYTDIF